MFDKLHRFIITSVHELCSFFHVRNKLAHSNILALEIMKKLGLYKFQSNCQAIK